MSTVKRSFEAIDGISITLFPQNDNSTQQKMMKELKPGRVIVVTIGHHYNKLGIFLSIAGTRELKIKVLVLDDISDANTRSVSWFFF